MTENKEFLQSPYSQAPNLSDWVKLAAHDLKLCIVDKHYVVDMSRWHEPVKDPNHCKICLAGALLAKTFGAKRTKNIDPSNVISVLGKRDDGFEIKPVINALDHFQANEITLALESFYRGFDQIDKKYSREIFQKAAKKILKATEGGLPCLYENQAQDDYFDSLDATSKALRTHGY